MFNCFFLQGLRVLRMAAPGELIEELITTAVPSLSIWFCPFDRKG